MSAADSEAEGWNVLLDLPPYRRVDTVFMPTPLVSRLMSRLLGVFTGVLMALFPAKFLTVMQDLAVENPDDFAERRWLASYVRMEGLVTVLVCLKGGRAYTAYMKYLGIVGATLLFFPRQYVEVGNRVAYEGSSPFEWKKGYLSRLRVCGAFFIVLALQALKRKDDTG